MFESSEVDLEEKSFVRAWLDVEEVFDEEFVEFFGTSSLVSSVNPLVGCLGFSVVGEAGKEEASSVFIVHVWFQSELDTKFLKGSARDGSSQESNLLIGSEVLTRDLNGELIEKFVEVW